MIASISITIATLGALLLCMLAMRIRAADAGSNLKQHRAKDAGLADLLNYAAMVDDGVIVGKNGSFIAAWMYQGDDNASSTDEQRDMVSFRINQALLSFNAHLRLHAMTAQNRKAPIGDANQTHREQQQRSGGGSQSNLIRLAANDPEQTFQASLVSLPLSRDESKSARTSRRLLPQLGSAASMSASAFCEWSFNLRAIRR
jgi:hypothetical protein